MSLVKRIYRSFRRRIFGDFDDYLKSCRGIIHIGANSGQEREHYQKLGLDVIWIEPIPEVFETLCRNIIGFQRQRAIRALVTDKDNQPSILHVANNQGASSSIFALAKHKDIWPDVDYVGQVSLSSVTLPTVIVAEKIDLDRYDALLIDTQGSEFSILIGAKSLLKSFRFIQVEAADFEAYAGAEQRDAISSFLNENGFSLKRERTIATRDKIGAYYDLVFERLT